MESVGEASYARAIEEGERKVSIDPFGRESRLVRTFNYLVLKKRSIKEGWWGAERRNGERREKRRAKWRAERAGGYDWRSWNRLEQPLETAS